MPDGTITAYDLAKNYRFERYPIDDVQHLHRLLRTLAEQPKRCIIRGQPNDGLEGKVERNLDNFHDEPSRLLMVDIDKFTPTSTDPGLMCAEFVATLPAAFQDVSYVWQLSGSMGHPSAAGLRAHLWFWLAEPVGCEILEAWAKEFLPGTDSTVHRAVQINYSADPVVHTGNDPYAKQRLGFVSGMLGDELVLDLSAFVPNPAATATVKRADRLALNDPRKKQGIIGRVCRAFNPYDLPRLFPDTFAKGSGKRKERFTWVAGGGAKEGLRVGDSGQHVLNSHSTSPIGNRAVNIFDLIRTHVHGHLDANLEPDALALDPTAAPSYAATVAWALQQPELQTAEAHQAAKEVVEEAVEQKIEEAADGKDDRVKRMSNLLKGVGRLTDIDSLEHDLAPRIAMADLTPGEREVIMLAVKAKTRQLMPGTQGLSLPVVRGMLAERDASGQSMFPDLNEDGSLKSTIDNVAAVCAREGITLRYNVITKEEMITGDGMACSKEDAANASLNYIISRCAKHGMRPNAGLIGGYVDYLCQQNQFNPVLEWIGSKPWDGVSRMDAVGDTIVAREDFPPATKRLMIRRWLIQAAALAASPTPLVARGVLIVQGDQYIGKSRWLKSLAPGHEDLVALGVALDPNNKDSVKKATTRWLCELGELDATFRKADIAMLKAFIAQDEDVLRNPYAKRQTTYQRRTALYGSVNDEQFLHDMTGNTRFWGIPVIAMDHAHGIDMQQVWAEALALWDEGRGEQHWLTIDEMHTVNQSAERFEVHSLLHERVLQEFEWDRWKAGDPTVCLVERGTLWILNRIGGNPTGGDPKSLGITLKRISGLSPRRTNKGRVYRVPVDAAIATDEEWGSRDPGASPVDLADAAWAFLL